MRRAIPTLMIMAGCACDLAAAEVNTTRGRANAESKRPTHFPHRIWAACDFEGRTPDYAWFGSAESNNVPKYPGNATALASSERPYKEVSAVMTGINPVPGPRMGKVNHLYCRYLLRGGTEATVQYFSLTREDNQHIRVTGLTEGKWSEVTMNFTRDARRNDGSPEPFGDGERMDDLKIFAGRPDEAARCDLWIDDVIFFANDPSLPPDPEPFPNRVIFLAAFDTGPKEKYWPGDFDVVEKEVPLGANWRAARAVPRKDGRGKLVRLQIEPPRPVGAHTKLRFRYYLDGANELTVQIFDATVQDNRHIRVTDLKQREWTTTDLDFSRESRRNDGTADSPFTTGNKVDDLFFFASSVPAMDVQLFVDEIVLYDAGNP